jgi:hypothetical protein
MAYFPDEAPPFITFFSRYGLGLKTRSAAAARARIDKLLPLTDEVMLESVSLSVSEPCASAFIGALFGPIERDVAFRGGGAARTDLADKVASGGHVHDAVAAEAWQRFGAPNSTQMYREKPSFYVGWTWRVEDVTQTQRALDVWFPFLQEHDRLQQNDYANRVQIRGVWQFRLRSQRGTAAAAPYPPSQVSAVLIGRHASAFFELVFPYAEPVAEFIDDYRAVCAAMGLALPPGMLRLCSPKKKGRGRTYRKIAPF